MEQSLVGRMSVFLPSQSYAGWHSSTTSTSTTGKSTCRSRRSFLRERATATSSSSSQSFTWSIMWVFSHAFFTNAFISIMLCAVFNSVHSCWSPCLLSLPHQLSFVFAEFPMLFVLNGHLRENDHILYNVKGCGKDMSLHLHWLQPNKSRTRKCQDWDMGKL